MAGLRIIDCVFSDATVADELAHEIGAAPVKAPWDGHLACFRGFMAFSSSARLSAAEKATPAGTFIIHYFLQAGRVWIAFGTTGLHQVGHDHMVTPRPSAKRARWH